VKEYEYGDFVMWKSSSYYGDRRPDEMAFVLEDGGKDEVKLLCLDGQERWVKKENVYE